MRLTGNTLSIALLQGGGGWQSIKVPAALSQRFENLDGFLVQTTLGVSLTDIYSMHRRFFFEGSKWFLEESQQFSSEEKCGNRWLALPSNGVVGALGKSFPRQLELLPEGSRIPSAAEVVWSSILYRVLTGIPLLCGIALRTSSRAANGNRVYVGFDEETGGHGINIWHLDDYQDDPRIGLAVDLNH